MSIQRSKTDPLSSLLMFAWHTWFMIVLCRLHTYRHEFQVWRFFTSIQTQRQAAVTLMNRCSFISCSRLRRHCSVCLPAHTRRGNTNTFFFLLSLSVFPQLTPSPVLCPCVETEGFWCCPRQWTIWVISCAPVSYGFVLRQHCSRVFCLAGLSHGSQTSLFLPFPFHVAMCEWDESAAIVVWFSDFSIGSNDRGFDVQC